MLDRNGLRPARYVITKDRHITLASEIGVYDYAPEDVVAKGRLKPGQMLAADTETGQLLLPEDVDNLLKDRHPYKKWLHKHLIQLESQLEETDAEEDQQPFETGTLKAYQKLFNLTLEEADQILRVLAEAGQEAIGAMGDDTPMPVLSKQQRALYDYFRQQFAQVTNPPIDPLREQIVMSLETCFGREKNIFEETEDHAKRMVVDSPVLSRTKFLALTEQDDPEFAVHTIDLNYPADKDLKQAIEDVCEEAEKAVAGGKVIIVLSDRQVTRGKLPIHALLATGAVHHHLVAKGLRCDSNLVVETATARDPHHFACLIGYGATAVYPYLAYGSLRGMIRSGQIKGIAADKLRRSYRKGINKGLFKILSKMGISTIASYRGAQLFEAVGLSDEVVDLCFRGTTSRVQGAASTSSKGIRRSWPKRPGTISPACARAACSSSCMARNTTPSTRTWSRRCRRRWSPATTSDYKRYAELVNKRPVTVLRDLLEVKEGDQAIPLDEVEAAGGHSAALRFGGHVPGRAVAGGPRVPGHGHEPPGRAFQFRRGRRGRIPLRHRAHVQDQAGGLRPLRRHPVLPGQCRGAADQGGPGRQARRRRPAAGPQGQRDDRPAALLECPAWR